MHRRTYDDIMLVNLLASRTKKNVVEAKEKEIIVPGFIYVSPSDYHLLIEKDGSFFARCF